MISRLRNKSLGVRFGAILFVILFAGQFVTAIWFLTYTKRQFSQRFDQKIRTVDALISGAAETSLLSYDYTLLLRLLDHVTEDEDIAGVRIFDSAGNEVAAKSVEDLRPSTEDPFFFFSPFQIRNIPLLAGGETLGQIELVVSSKAANRELKKIFYGGPVFLGVMMLGALGLVYGFFTYIISRPLDRLNRALEQISERNLTVSLDERTDDEIGRLFRGFNYVVEALRNNLGRLKSTGVDVTTAIRQMEQVFEKVGDGADRQVGSVTEMGTLLGNAEASREGVFERTETLANLFQENVASVLEVRASIAEINKTTDSLFDATDGAYSSVTDVSASARQIAASSEELTTTIDETSVSVEEINNTIRQVEGNARKSASAAAAVSETASREGMFAVAAARDGMAKIREEVSSSAEVIRRLGGRSKDIEKILDVIREVTEQTNLLSLNAAILAAQAGEHGKGFGVVADEIGSLAERTASSTHEIASIIGTIRGEIADAVGGISVGVERVEEGSRLVGEVEETLRKTKDFSENASELAISIEKSTVEQARNMSYISEAVDRIQTMTRQVSQALRQQDAGLDGLRQNIGGVRDAAEMVRKGMNEQNAGIQMISDHLETTNAMVNEITESTFRQKSDGHSLVTGIESIRNIGMGNRDVISELRSTLRTLFCETDEMKQEVERFRLS